MSILKISLRNLLNKPLSALLTVIMLTMGVALVSMLLLVGEALDESFKKNIKGIDMVVGAKGSPLQLILAAVYQIDNPTGNISRAEAQKLARNPMVASAIEVSFGDSYKGRRIVGTSHAYTELYEASLENGKLWEAPFEATIGSTVAEEFGLKTGDTFYSAHGSDMNAEVHEDHPFTVVGVFKPSGTVVDRLLLTSQQSIWDVHGPETDSTALADREITALLVKFKSKMGMISLPRIVNQQTSMQAALPSIEVNRLFELFGIGIATLRIVAIAIMLLGGVSVFVSMLSALKERAYEMALIRSMGASRLQVFTMILTEAVMLGIVGTLLGLLISRSGIAFLNGYANQQFGIAVDIWHLVSAEYILGLVTIIICIFAAIIPAIRIMRLDVSKVLSSYAQ
jgi:putative ABC transport system permease protein